MSRFRTIGVAAMIAATMDIVCTGIWLSAGFPLGPLMYYPAYALLYPAFCVERLIPEGKMPLDESFAIGWLLPFIEFFSVALVALEVRRRRVVADSKKNDELDNQEGKV